MSNKTAHLNLCMQSTYKIAPYDNLPNWYFSCLVWILFHTLFHAYFNQIIFLTHFLPPATGPIYVYSYIECNFTIFTFRITSEQYLYIILSIRQCIQAIIISITPPTAYTIPPPFSSRLFALNVLNALNGA